MAEENGPVQTYYGDSKGKTTAAFELALQCAGWGQQMVIAQFLRGSPRGELTVAERFPTLTVLCSKGIHKFAFQMNDEKKAVMAENCRTLLRQAAELVQAEDTRLLVLDEMTDALRGFLPQEELCAFLSERPASLEVVLTDHSLLEVLECRANYITHMVREKHPYDRGVTARREIEFQPGSPRSELRGLLFTTHRSGAYRWS